LHPGRRWRRSAGQFACSEREFEHAAALTTETLIESDSGPAFLDEELLEVLLVAAV